ncbi:MAG: hypothetical protein PHW79_02565 [Candidatus Marinimicrobia bacterium]|nr:hypothetical protein [Candidatus Neomarinimicrobiota bacterium]
MSNHSETSAECCPKFDPAPWDEKSHIWKDKRFIQDEVCQIFHMPMNMSKVVTRMWSKIQAADAAPATADFLMLAYDPSPWKSELYMNITKDVPDAKMVTLSGTFLSKVFDGQYNEVPKWIKSMEAFVKSQGKVIKRHYFYYTTCPKCAKKYGHNYVVDFAEVE